MTAPRLIYPCNTHRVTCGFYCYPHHDADDLGAVMEVCRAAATGRVKTVHDFVVPNAREGRYIEIEHEGGWITRYFHLSICGVVVGQHVRQGDQIGVTGNSGFARPGVPYAPHLHFALWAPTFAEALTVWDYPQSAYGFWAVSPVWVIEHQLPEEDDMEFIMRSPDKTLYTYDIVTQKKGAMNSITLRLLDGVGVGYGDVVVGPVPRKVVDFSQAEIDAVPFA